MKPKQVDARRVYYTLDDNKSREIYVSKHIDDVTFKEFKRLVAVLVEFKRYGKPMTPRDWNGINNLPSSLRDILAKHELFEKRVEHVTPKLGGFLEDFRSTLTNLDLQTQYHYQRSCNYLLDYFPQNMRIDLITPGKAESHCHWLMTERANKGKKNLKDTTVFRHRTAFNTIFDYGVKHKYISESSYVDVRVGRECNEERQFYVSVEIIDRILPFCPDDEFRLLLMLARHAGLRIPSEIREMKLEHFHENRFDIIEGKTGRRSVPFFPAIRSYFEIVRVQAKPGREYVFEYYRNHANPGTVLKRAIEAADLDIWPKLFNNLRSSCITDKERKGWPESTMNMVFGNSKRIREKNYVQRLRDEEFAALCGIPKPPSSSEAGSAKMTDYKYSIQEFEPSCPDVSDFWEMAATAGEQAFSKVSGDFSDFRRSEVVVSYEAFQALSPYARFLYGEEYGDDVSL
jgi:hypothetical protein